MQKQTFRLGNYRLLNILCSSSSFALVLFGLFVILPPVPVYNPVQADGTYLVSSPVSATITMTVPTNNVTVAANPNANFVSNAITASVTTDNYTGYKLSANLSGANTALSHTTPEASDTVPSITANYVASSFPTNYWGISVDNTNYSPAPSSASSSFVIKNHTAAISNQSSSLYIGAKVSNNQTSGTYTNNIVLTSLVNPADYKITYNKNTTDTVSNLPDIKQGQVTANANTLSTNTPTRTGYTFLGWSESSSATTASWSAGSTFYLDATKNNTNINLYAVWKINTYTVTFNVNEAGYGTVSRSTQTANYGSVVSTSGATATVAGTNTTATAASQTAQYSYAFSSWTNGCGNTVTGNCTITANFSRTTRSYTVTFNVNEASYGTVNRSTQTVTYGGTVSISGATATVAGTATTATPSTSYIFNNWANGCGNTVTDNCTITANFAKPTLANITYMQEMTSDICTATRTPSTTDGSNTSQYKLIDNRDNKEYFVAKLADGKCWMTQNLDLDLSTAKTLTASNTDISANWTPVRSTIATSNLASWDDSYTSPYSYDPGDTYYYTSNSNSDDIKYTSLSACTGAGHTADDCKHYHVGNYYNFSAAIASNNSSNLTSQYQDAPNSICPKGWRLWRANHNENEAGEMSNLLAIYGLISSPSLITREWKNWGASAFNAFKVAPFFMSRYGVVAWGVVHGDGSDANFWSSTIYSSIDSYMMNFNYSSVRPQYYGNFADGNRVGGFPIRCVAR